MARASNVGLMLCLLVLCLDAASAYQLVVPSPRSPLVARRAAAAPTMALPSKKSTLQLYLGPVPGTRLR